MHSSGICTACLLTVCICVCVCIYVGGGVCPGGVPSDLSNHAFDVTCMLPPHQLTGLQAVMIPNQLQFGLSKQYTSVSKASYNSTISKRVVSVNTKILKL